MKPKLGTFVTALLAGTFANNPVKQLVRGVPPRNPAKPEAYAINLSNNVDPICRLARVEAPADR
jgi:hypothetical protein